MSNHEDNPTRIRFAPSPTGYLHVGGARTAIFNWLHARQTGGAFVLRIEDTDDERSTRDSETSLIEDLHWLGIYWDEGPDVGGAYGPYRQSERLDLYRAAADTFVEKGLAYPCFCTKEELQRRKEAATAAGESPHYDGTCRDLTVEQIEEKRRAGIPETVRFKVPDENVEFDDLVRGPIRLQSDMVGDFVILRSNGLPTYNFAAAHDDHFMKITRVLRGEDHLSNTLRQVLIYRAMDAEPPAFGHVSLILAEDRSKLSKRHGASSIEELHERGFLPDAVVNYLVLLGWSHPDEREKLTRDEMVSAFSIDRINKSAAVYDPKKLTWMNGLYNRDLSLDDWVAAASPFVPDSIKQRYGAEDQREILALLQEKVETLDRIPPKTDIFLDEFSYEEEAREILGQESSREVLEALRRELESLADDWTPENIKAAFKKAGKAAGRKGKELFFPIRAAVTGTLHGPDLSRVTAVKGKATVLQLIERALRE
jgi:nondiscriminating glutamyl-tRNA synthetase